jgi:hypothetical protein
MQSPSLREKVRQDGRFARWFATPEEARAYFVSEIERYAKPM